MAKKVMPGTLLVTAAVMLLLMLIPADFWHHPANDAVYRGFDPNLVYTSDTSVPYPEQGRVDVVPGSIRFTAVSGSQPAATLLTAAFKSFRVAMDVRIRQIPAAGEPFRVGIWSLRRLVGYFVVFGPAPDDALSVETLIGTAPGQTLVGSTAISRTVLGTYSPDTVYHVELAIDKDSEVATARVTTSNDPLAGTTQLRLDGGPASPAYSDISSDPVPVKAGNQYSFGGLVQLVSGGGTYKLSVRWLDAGMQLIDVSNDWLPSVGLLENPEQEFTGQAPAGAAYAQLDLGSDNNTELLFTNLYLREANTPNNLLVNGDFRNGAQGWAHAVASDQPLALVPREPVSGQTTLAAASAPALFKELHLSVTASAASSGGETTAEIGNYALTVPHQRWQVVKIDDLRVKLLSVALALLGVLLIGLKLRAAIRHRLGGVTWAEVRTRCLARLDQPWTVPHRSVVMIASVAVAAFVLLNLLLFNLGSHPFDMLTLKIATYITMTSGMTSLYHLPNTVTMAKIWNGGPYHEAIFPYSFVMAYYFTAIGWIYRFLFSGPGFFQVSSYQLDLLIKTVGVLFNALDGVLIYLILRRISLSRWQSLIAAGLFVLNPAIWFSTSIWGQNHVVSIFFLLAAILSLELDHPTWAWFNLALSSMTRPQMLIPTFLLAIVLLRRFSVRRNMFAISWTIIGMFLLLMPFTLAYAPSSAVDVIRNDLQVQEAGGNEPELTQISLDTYSVWTLVDAFTSRTSGISRFEQSSETALVGRLTYQRVAQLMTIVALAAVTGALLFIRGRCRSPGDYLPLLALGTVAFMIFTTGLAATHFVIALPLLLLCKKYLRDSWFYSIVGIWTVTTFVSMYGAFGASITPDLVPSLHPSHDVLTRFFVWLYSADWFISIASFQNTLVLAGLAVVAFGPIVRGRRGAAVPVPSVQSAAEVRTTGQGATPGSG